MRPSGVQGFGARRRRGVEQALPDLVQGVVGSPCAADGALTIEHLLGERLTYPALVLFDACAAAGVDEDRPSAA